MVLNQKEQELQLHPTAKILGFNINGMRTALVYGDMNGLVYECLQIDTPFDMPFINALEIICKAAEKLLSMVQAQRLPGPEVISLAISGDIDTNRGMLVSAPDLPQWKNAPIKGRLAMRYNLPIFLEQEANACALAEYYFGAGQGFKNLVFISMEPTLRAGIIADGLIYHSPGGYAGNLGDIILAEQGPSGYGLPGSLNGFASAPGIVELAHLRFPHYWQADIGPYQLVEATNNGDENALKVFAEAGEWLGKGLCPLVRLLHPEVMIIGNPASLLEEAMLAPARRTIQTATSVPLEILPRLLPAKLGSRLNDLSALSPAIDHFRKQS